MIKKIFILILFSIIFCQEIKIDDIEIEGLIRLQKEDIYRISKLYPGMNLSRGDEINKAIHRLWKIGRFSNVQIFITDEKESSVSLKIFLDEQPVISSIEFNGNNKISTNKLKDEINLSSNQILSMNVIYESKEIITNLYKEDHFHNVKVNFDIQPTDKEYLKKVIFKIDEGNKLRIKNISISGNSQISDKKVLKSLTTIKKFHPLLFWRGKFDSDKFDLDILNLESFYKNLGYKDFQVINKEIVYNSNGIDILLKLNEGNIYYYNSIDFEGNSKFSNQELLDRINISIGDIYNEEKLNFAIYETITSLYMNEGHYFFNIDKEIIPVDGNKLNLKFTISENEKVKIRKVLVAGNSKTNENVIRREIRIYPGDTFNRENIINSIKQLFLLNFFQNVAPEIIPVSESEIDIKFIVEEKETGRANFSMGYNELHGFTGGGGFEFSNFMGKGQLVGIEYQRGLQNQMQSNSILPGSSSNSTASDYESFSIRFREPRLFDTRNSVSLSYSHQEQGTGQNNIYKYDIESNRASLSFGRRFKWPDIFMRGDWSFSISNTKYFGSESSLLSDFDPDVSNSEDSDIVLNDGSDYYALKNGVSLNQVISRDSRDHAEFPTLGSQFIWSTTISGGTLGGNVNYNKHLLSFTWYTPVREKIVLYQNYKFGVINELANNKFIPYNARFLMGGSGIPSVEMLRGYDNNSIGPGANYYSSEEGKIMLKYSLEMRYLLSESPIIYLLGFGEAGNVWTDFSTVDIFDLKRSVGIGIRLYMPMLGILGYDIGYGFDNIDGLDNPSGLEHHIVFGMPFN